MQDHGKFIEELQNVLDIKNERIYAFDSRNLDLDYPPIYKNAFYPPKEYRHPTDSAVTAYLDIQDDLFSEINWSVIFKFNSKKYTQHFINNYEKYRSLYGKTDTEMKLGSIIYYRVMAAIDSNSIIMLNDAMLICDKMEDVKSNKTFYRMIYFEKTKDWEGYAQELAVYAEREGIAGHMTINNSCWTLYENAEDKKILNQAIKLMEEVTEAHSIWMYMDTYAALLYKYGEFGKAEKIAMKAIQLGIEEGNERVSSTEQLLEKIIEKMNDVR